MALMIGTLVFALWRSHRAWSRDAVALWLEERAPSMRYALVTVVEQPAVTSAAELERAVETGAVRAADRERIPPEHRASRCSCWLAR